MPLFFSLYYNFEKEYITISHIEILNKRNNLANVENIHIRWYKLIIYFINTQGYRLNITHLLEK